MIHAAPKPRKKAKPSRTPLKRTRVRTRNVKRYSKNWLRAFGSPERVAFVKTLPCLCCRIVGHVENHHIESGGTSRKADADKIVPLCEYGSPSGTYGCHRRLHNIGRKTFERRYGLDLDAEAAKVEKLWQQHTEGK